MVRKEQWYYNKLSEYFHDHYEKYDFDIRWYINPAINQWRFKIPELNVEITITCDYHGNITEVEEPLREE